MRPVVPLTVAFAAAGAAALALAPELRPLVWAGLALGYLGVVTVGVVDMRSQLLGRATWRGPPQPRVALTYDDGPDPASTPALLDLLAARGARATFFLVGERARAHPDLVRRIAAEGHLVGNHSDRHRALTNVLFAGPLRRELEAAQATLSELAGEVPRYYRPPIGLMNHATAGVARALGLTLVGWQVRSLDTTGRAEATVAARVLARVRPGGVVLLHDGGLPAARVVAISAAVLDGLAARDLEPVRLDALLAPGG